MFACFGCSPPATVKRQCCRSSWLSGIRAASQRVLFRPCVEEPRCLAVCSWITYRWQAVVECAECLGSNAALAFCIHLADRSPCRWKTRATAVGLLLSAAIGRRQGGTAAAASFRNSARLSFGSVLRDHFRLPCHSLGPNQGSVLRAISRGVLTELRSLCFPG